MTDAQLKAVISAEIRARRMRDLARERLARARAEQAAIEEELRHADVAIRQGQARLQALADHGSAPSPMHDVGASRPDAGAPTDQQTAHDDPRIRLTESNAQPQGLVVAIELGQAENARLRADLESARATQARLRQEIDSARHITIGLAGELGDLQSQGADLQTRMRREIDSIAASESELDALLRRRDVVEATRQATTERVLVAERLESESARKHEAARVRAAALRAALRLLKEQHEASLQEIGRVRQDIDAVTATRHSLAAEFAHLHAEESTLRASTESGRSSIVRTQALLEEVREERAALCTALENERRALEERRIAMTKAVARAQAALGEEETVGADIARQLDAMRRQAADLADSLNRETAEVARLQRQLKVVRSAREFRSAECAAAGAGQPAPSANDGAAIPDVTRDEAARPHHIVQTEPTASVSGSKKPGPRWRPALITAFGAAALVIYLVPRLWPGDRAIREAAQTPPARNALPPAPRADDIYPVDVAAQRDLLLDREIRTPHQPR